LLFFRQFLHEGNPFSGDICGKAPIKGANYVPSFNLSGG